MTSARGSESQAHLTSALSAQETPNNEGFISFLANSEFTVRKATTMCALLSLVGMPSTITGAARVSFLSHILKDDECTIRVVGALLSFIVQNGVIGICSNGDDSIHINGISYRNYCEVMRISLATMHDLLIFNHDPHPLGRGSMRGKEGLSLYGVIKVHIKTQAGRLLLRSWLMYPLTNQDEIVGRQYLVRKLYDGSNRSLLLALRDALRNVRNVHSCISNICKKAASINDWKGLYGSCKAFIALFDALRTGMKQRDDLGQAPLIAKIMEMDSRALRDAIGWMDAVIDFENSSVVDGLMVAPGFNENIDSLRRSLSVLNDVLAQVGFEELEKVRSKENCPELNSLCIEYQPLLGYLLLVEHEDVEREGFSIWEELGFEFFYKCNESGYYFKNDRCRELDEEPGDIIEELMNLEAQAYHYVEGKILPSFENILKMARVVTELDCIQALASTAKEHSWTMPIVNREFDGIDIENGRHALASLTVASFVPNSTRMRGGDIHIMTG